MSRCFSSVAEQQGEAKDMRPMSRAERAQIPVKHLAADVKERFDGSQASRRRSGVCEPPTGRHASKRELAVSNFCRSAPYAF